MAKWILLNEVIVSGPGTGVAAIRHFPGETIDDTQTPTAPIIAGGGILWPSTDPVVAAAQVIANFLKSRGQGQTPKLSETLLASAIYSLTGGSGGPVLGPAALVNGLSLPGLVQKRTATIGFAAFAAAVTNTFNIGAILPADARILKREMRIATEFTGGGLTTMTCSIGIATRTTDIVNAQDVFGTTGNIDGAAGTDTGALYSAASQLIATFTGSAADAPTAGSVAIDVLFVAGL